MKDLKFYSSCNYQSLSEKELSKLTKKELINLNQKIYENAVANMKELLNISLICLDGVYKDNKKKPMLKSEYDVIEYYLRELHYNHYRIDGIYKDKDDEDSDAIETISDLAESISVAGIKIIK